MKALIILVLLGFGLPLSAEQTTSEETTTAERTPASQADYQQIARDRLYEGGADEEDLAVQDSLPVPHQGLSEKALLSRYMKQYFDRKQAGEASSDSEE